MKRLFIPTLVLVLSLSFAACGGNSDTPAGSNPSSNNSSSQSTNGSEPASSQEQTPSETSAPQKSSGGAATDGMGDKLAGAYIDMISGGTYYMKYRSSEEFEGEKMDVVAEFAINGDNTAIIYEMEGMSMHMIVKDDKTHIVNHEEKTVMVMPTGSTQQDDAGAFPESDFVFKGSGTGELFGFSLPYEEYSTDSGDVRFFFDEKKLAGFESSFEGMIVQMEIQEMSKDIPSGMFDLPSGYEVTEY